MGGMSPKAGSAGPGRAAVLSGAFRGAEVPGAVWLPVAGWGGFGRLSWENADAGEDVRLPVAGRGGFVQLSWENAGAGEAVWEAPLAGAAFPGLPEGSGPPVGTVFRTMETLLLMGEALTAARLSDAAPAVGIRPGLSASGLAAADFAAEPPPMSSVPSFSPPDSLPAEAASSLPPILPAVPGAVRISREEDVSVIFLSTGSGGASFRSGTGSAISPVRSFVWSTHSSWRALVAAT